MPSFPPIQCVLEKARRFRQAGTYLTGAERKRFEDQYLPYYLDWAKHLFELGLWTESRCLFQEIQSVKQLEPPFAIMWEILEEEIEERLTAPKCLELINKNSNENIQTLAFPRIFMIEGDLVKAKEVYDRIKMPLKKSIAGQLIDLQLNKRGCDMEKIQSMLNSELKGNNDQQQSIFILLQQFLEARKVIDEIKSESNVLEKKIMKDNESIGILQGLISRPFSDFSFHKIQYLIQRAGTIAKDFGTKNDQEEISKLQNELQIALKALPVANKKDNPAAQKDKFYESLQRNYFTDFEYGDYLIKNTEIYKEIMYVRGLFAKLNIHDSLLLPLIFWEIRFEMESIKYLYLLRLKSLLRNDNFINWCQRQREFKILSKLTVFVSYSTLDTLIMQKIVKILGSHGIETILDTNVLKTGQDINSELDNHIINVNHTILLVSQNSLTSGWVLSEASFSLMIERVLKDKESGKKLILIVIDQMARINFSFFGDQITQNLFKKQKEIDSSRKLREDKIQKRTNQDIVEEQKRLDIVKEKFDIVLDMIKSGFALDFCDDNKIAMNTPKLIQRILEFNQAS